MNETALIWVGFLAVVALLLGFDLGVLNRKAHVIRAREALGWTSMWVSLALAFNVAIYFLYENHVLGIGEQIGHDINGREAATLFFTGYVVEQSLSLDNMFVIATIFAYLKTPAHLQRRVLFWGIIGAVVLRGVMILAGAALIHRFDWIIYVFGGLLLVSAVKMLTIKSENIDAEANWVVRIARRLYPISSQYNGERFFTTLDGKRALTPLAVALLMVESADLIFAVDSIPAIFAITTDPFIVFTSNVFAILGLRSLYFLLAAMLEKFRHLKVALAFVLGYVGVKMILAHHAPIDPLASLAIILGILAVGIAASLIDRRPRDHASTPLDDVELAARLVVRRARKIVIFVVGLTVLLLAIPIGLIPGPGGLLVAFLGVAILATEFVWAKRFLQKATAHANRIRSAAQRGAHDVGVTARRILGLDEPPSPRPATRGPLEAPGDE